MASKIVDVFDSSGARLSTYSIALEGNDCLDAEFEEAALIFAELSGRIGAKQIMELRACCDTAFVESVPERISEQPPQKQRKSMVVSLVKHRMRRVGIRGMGPSRRRAL
ncbi:MAG TPA: hypothetical protein VGF62_04515 [Rhizomicrobium sp.]